MNKLQKYSAIGGIIALVACWPLAVGKMTQDRISQTIQQTNTENYSIKLIRYDRGYLSASSEIAITITNPLLQSYLEFNDLPINFTFKQTIKHRILGASSVAISEGKALPLTINAFTYLTGSSEIKLRTGMISEAETPESIPTYYISPIRLNAEISRNGDIDFNYEIYRLAFNYRYAFKNINGFGRIEYKNNSALLTQKSIKIGHVTLLNFDNHISINKLQYHINNSYDQKTDRLTSQSLFSTKDIKLSKSFNIKNIDVDLTVSNMDTSSLFEFFENTFNFATKYKYDSADKAFYFLNQLFEKGLSISLNKFNVETQQGYFNIDGSITLPSGEKLVVVNILNSNIQNLIEVIKGQGDIFISQDMLIERLVLQDMLNDLVKDNLAIKQANGYTINTDIQSMIKIFRQRHNNIFLELL